MRASREADQDGPEPVRWNGDRDASDRTDHVLEAERVCGLGLTEDLKGAEHHPRAEHAGDDPAEGGRAGAEAKAVQAEEAADAEHRDKAQQEGGR